MANINEMYKSQRLEWAGHVGGPMVHILKK